MPSESQVSQVLSFGFAFKFANLSSSERIPCVRYYPGDVGGIEGIRNPSCVCKFAVIAREVGEVL